MMTRGVFAYQLDHLQEALLVMSSQVEWNLVASVSALQRRDWASSQALIEEDAQINESQVAIEQMCLGLIATQQPKARDLRLVTAVFIIASELERINDYAKGVAKINLQLDHTPLPPVINALALMAEKLQAMLSQSMKAFVERDVAAAYAIHASDAEIDTLYAEVQQTMLQAIWRDPRQTAQSNKLMWAAHNLERAGDRIGNICERVIFLATGVLRDLSR